MALTPKQAAFVSEYVIDWNATQAAIRAGYSEKSAGAIGAENLTKPEIQEVIARTVAERAMDANEALILLGQQARASLADFISDWGSGWKLDLKKAADLGVLHLIKKLKYDNKGRPEIELHDAQSALFMVLKAQGVLVDKTEHSGPDGGPVIFRVLFGDDGGDDAND